MVEQEKKGDDYVKQAEKKLNSWSWSDKYYEVSELYEKAGNAFKVAKAWQKGGDVFRKLTELHLKQKDNQHDAASSLVEAANCYKKANSGKEVTICLEQAVELYTDGGRLTMAARYSKDLAEWYEKEENILAAMDWYERAADLYQTESASSSVNQMKLKIAEFAALEAQYTRAVELFEEVAKNSLSSNLLKFGAKNHFLHAGICLLCLHDSVAIQNGLDRYLDLDSNFGDSREFKLLSNLAAAMEEGDVDLFTDHLKEFDSISRLDSWKTALLLRAKESIQNEEEILT